MEHRRNAKQAEALRQQVMANLQRQSPNANTEDWAAVGRKVGDKIRQVYGDRTVVKGVDQQALSAPETATPATTLSLGGASEGGMSLFGGEGASDLMKYSLGGSKRFTHRELKTGYRRL